MDEKTLSEKLIAAGNITAVCFKSALGNGKGDAEYQTVNYPVSLDALKDAIDASMTNKVSMHVNAELGKRQFFYGELDGALVLVETCLTEERSIVTGFIAREMRAASWRSISQPVAA